MQAVTQYPSPINDANLRVLDVFKKKFNLNVGYSDHSPGDLVVLASVALGACVIEKHFTMNKKMSGPDHPHSLDPVEFNQMVQQIRKIESALGDGIKKIEKSEKETRIIQQRGIWTTKKIVKGEKFTKSNTDALRPMMGLSASKYTAILGKKSRRNFDVFEPIKKQDVWFHTKLMCYT